jgi:hypothetical protein
MLAATRARRITRGLSFYHGVYGQGADPFNSPGLLAISPPC